jgi:8-oxo-dGTP diphosphatase
MTEYVAGFMFWKGEVALVRKNRPAWQAGKLNGIGGHVEADESPIAAIVREFREETGVETTEAQWLPVCVLSGNDFKVHFFRTMNPLSGIKTTTDEEIVVIPVDEVTVHNAIPNLTWLIPMSKSLVFDRADSFHVQEVA